MFRHLAFYGLLWLRDFVQLAARTLVGISVVGAFAGIFFARSRLAAGGYLLMPFVISFGFFLCGRLYDQVLFMVKPRKMSICLTY